MIYAGESRQNKDGTTSVNIASTVTPSELRELGIMPLLKTEEENPMHHGNWPFIHTVSSHEDAETPQHVHGLCVVCHGALEEKKVTMEAPRSKFLPVEPHEPYIEVADGYFCIACGLRYEFIPGSRASHTSD